VAERDDDLERQLVLADLVNRVLDRGVTILGDVTISVAGVDLVYLGLRLDVAAVESAGPATASARFSPLARRLGPSE
jgi:hypothetical protein